MRVCKYRRIRKISSSIALRHDQSSSPWWNDADFGIEQYACYILARSCIVGLQEDAKKVQDDKPRFAHYLHANQFDEIILNHEVSDDGIKEMNAELQTALTGLQVLSTTFGASTQIHWPSNCYAHGCQALQ